MDIRKQLTNVAESMENGHITNENGNYYHHHEKSMEIPQTFKNKTTCSPSSNKCTDEQNQSTKSYIYSHLFIIALLSEVMEEMDSA